MAYVITPATVADAHLISSTIAEPDTTQGEVEWNAATSYVIGDQVIRTTTHRIYENLIAGVDATLPENATGGTTPRWLDIGPTNRWAMFDAVSGSASTATGSIEIVLAPTVITAVACLEVEAHSVRCVVTDGSGGETLFDEMFYLYAGAASWWEYFFAPAGIRTQAIFDAIAAVGEPYITLTFTAYDGSTVNVGTVKVGTVMELGGVHYGATAGIIDYSRKETDAFGRTTLVQRAFSKRTAMRLHVEKPDIPALQRKLAGLRATPAIWVGTTDSDYEPLVVYGFYKDFSIEIAYPTVSLVSIEIEGLA